MFNLLKRKNTTDNTENTEKPFDIVFLDPPYEDDLLLPTCFFLEEKGFLSNEAYIYLEAKQVLNESELPEGWKIIKSKSTGQVRYHLALREKYDNE